MIDSDEAEEYNKTKPNIASCPKPPFYILDEVDAALDSQHAERAGALMARVAAKEGVDYIAISHRPEVYLHAERLVGMYGCAGGSTGCVALNFKSNTTN